MLTDDLYVECERVLEAVDSGLGAAECHGLICGTLCAGDRPDPGSWLPAVVDEAPGTSESLAQCRAVLIRVMEDTHLGLSAPDFRFTPLLPDDDEPLAVRARALGQWCSGFLYGLGLGGVSETTDLSADAREVLADLSEFTNIADDVESSRELEADYTELVEYLRVGVMLVHDESARWTRPDQDPRARH